ncbi:MAG TPA: HEAT repeat domain-containing protein [Candidatus Obscuribacterales bacterium]
MTLRFFRRVLGALSIALALVLACAQISLAQLFVGGYEGLEFFGSSQMTRAEMERILRLKPGASYKSVSLAVEKLKKQLELRHLEGNVQLVSGDGGEIYISADIISQDNEMPTRALRPPQHVDYRSEKPAMLLEKLHERIAFLESQGRPLSEQIKDGIRYYSDEPCNQIVKELIEFAPDMRLELLSLIDHDPNAIRRRTAVELLNWAGEVPDTTLRLLPALDDSDVGVRGMVARYIFPRLSYLPEDFPLPHLVQACSRLLRRPSHQDRSKAVYMLLALSRKKPECLDQIRQEDGAVIKELYQKTIIPSLRGGCKQLLKAFSVQEAKRKEGREDFPFLPP